MAVEIADDRAAHEGLVHHDERCRVGLRPESLLAIGVGRGERRLHESVESVDKGIAVAMAELVYHDRQHSFLVVCDMSVVIVGTSYHGRELMGGVRET